MIHIVMSLSERYALSIIGSSLRNFGYKVADVWGDSIEIPTDGDNDIIDSAWYAGQVIQKMADMCADTGLINDGDVVVYDGDMEIMPVIMKYLFQGRNIHLVELIGGDLTYQGQTYQPKELMEHIDNLPQ